MNYRGRPVTLLAASMLLGCAVAGGDGKLEAGPDGAASPTGLHKVHGAVNKGPFVLGASVRVAPIDDTLASDGRGYMTHTVDDLGRFELENVPVGPLLLEASGYYFDEVRGRVSTSTLTLRGLAPRGDTVHINIVTHLTLPRVKALVASGVALIEAVARAEDELRKAAGIVRVPPRSGSEMALVDPDQDAAAYLFAVSAIFVQASMAPTRETGAEAALSELLDRTAEELADGSLSAATTERLIEAQRAIDAFDVRMKLEARFAELHVDAQVPPIERFLDHDGDGMADADDACPLVASAPGAHAIGRICMTHRQITALAPTFGTEETRLHVDRGATRLSAVVSAGRHACRIRAATGEAVALDTFALPKPYDAIAALADVDADGRSDLFVSVLNGTLSGTGAVLAGAPEGAFGDAVPLPGRSGLDYLLTVFDFDGDGLPDILGHQLADHSPTIFVRRGAAPQWASPMVVLDNSDHQYIERPVAGDVDGDGRPDVVSFTLEGDLRVRSSGAGLFGTVEQVSTTDAAYATPLAIGDADGDGMADIVVLARKADDGMGDNRISLLRGHGNGAFDSQLLFSDATSRVAHCTVGNFTGLARVDVACADGRDVVVYAFETGRFAPVQRLRASTDGAIVALDHTDLDGRGRHELVVLTAAPSLVTLRLE
jgi:hypothetical protein